MDSTPANIGSSPNKTPSRPVATRTPISRRAVSAEPSSTRHSAVHTPLERTSTRELLNSVRRGVSASGGRRANAPTPHATAARRALDQRRTALFTPGKVRRQSLNQQRETPMGILRQISKVLAPTTKPIVTSSSPRDGPSSIAPIREEDEEDDLTIDRPRLSLPIDQDDDSELLPPESAGLEDDNYTVRSVELPRRARSEQPGRLSRASFGSIRDSDVFDADDATQVTGRQSDFFPGLLEDLQAQANAAYDPTLTRVDVDPRRSTLGRESDFGLVIPPGVDDQTTFLMSEPPADGGETSPLAERSFAEAGAYNAGADLSTRDVATAATGGDEVDIYPDTESDPDSGPADQTMVDDPADAYAEGLEEADEVGAQDETMPLEPSSAMKPSREPSKPKKRQRRISKHGIEYPALPPSFVKRVAQTALQSSGLSNPRVSTDTLTALTQASEWFFEQLGDDLGAYANHAKRTIVEESDVATLMRRQRQITSGSTMFSLAQRHLPRELLQELRMPVPLDNQRHVKRLRSSENDDEGSSEVT